MREFKDKRKRKERLYSLWAVLALFVVFLLLLHAVWGIYQKEKEARQLQEDSAQRYQSILNQEQDLSSSVTKLNTEEGVDSELRQKYGVVKPGEEIIVVESVGATSTATSSSVWYNRFFNAVESWF